MAQGLGVYGETHVLARLCSIYHGVPVCVCASLHALLPAACQSLLDAHTCGGLRAQGVSRGASSLGTLRCTGCSVLLGRL